MTGYLAVVRNAADEDGKQLIMAIGSGIVLIVVGLIFVLDVINVDTTVVDTATLGWILLVAGILAVVISLIVNQQRSRSTVVQEQRDPNRPL